MTTSTPDPPSASKSTPLGLGPSLIVLVSLLTALAIPGTWMLNAALRRREAYRKFESGLKYEHPGLLAWFDDDEAKVLDVADLPGEAKARKFEFDGELKRVFFSHDGRTLFAVKSKGTVDEVHSLIALEVASGLQRTILDLGTAKLEDDDFDLAEMWVIPWGDAESENDRIVFKLGGADCWYSVEGKRPRVRPEAGRPAKAWDQTKCPEGTHEFRSTSSKDKSKLVIADGRFTITVTGKKVDGPGAWWCSRR
ncbi:MAG: hypothetical protein FD180_2978 [Planctomycetota bacterium]|nr:MAG: hypothetical protein FD180_2978 [Planctomycetota bacterium]